MTTNPAWVGIVCNTTTRTIARIVAPSSDSGLKNEIIGPNEIMMRMPLVIFRSLGNHNDVAAYLGLAG